MRVPLTALVLIIGMEVSCQDTLIAVYGAITDVLEGTAIHPAEVTAYAIEDTMHRSAVEVDPEGRYMLGLFEKRNYMIRFSGDGYYPKFVEVRLEGPSEEQWEHGYGLSVDMGLYKELPGAEFELNEDPVGRSIYDREKDVFEWDKAYTNSKRSKQKDLMKAYKRQLGKTE